MNIKAQIRMASEILGVGQNSVWIDPEYIDEVLMAISREDIRSLIKDGIIRKKPKKGISSFRSKKRKLEKKKGRHRGYGSRKGKKTARAPKKKQWINKIRPQRRMLKKLREEGKIEKAVYRKYYRLAKGNSFKNTKDMIRHLRESKLLKGKISQ
ncbi:MAG: 50S ribosomal protein L19e [Promethearchaeota archaeon]